MEKVPKVTTNVDYKIQIKSAFVLNNQLTMFMTSLPVPLPLKC